ncbi:beta-alanine-activating enzyme isoform X1 [Apodemus sylvaticus]|uniref:beta-alanine-activating enzyme isoform X1 n=1 Tax=Apodemus sylvaticus TaxID=10129 RepID=UPI0022420BAF|nr:beta-alanine-activating enzyme isoform X1 [Apodemus sylvaticus]XP_052054640.1 beta-alanine-activating enzyme isoform X1 [Apodemus sylvaticus]XP_052054641.1 beta-alanine-activating enzyme isoform X1 [Apodemus sylvaticus]
MTLQELVLRAASLYLDRTAVCFDDGNSQPPVCCTYRALLSEASALSDFLRAHCDFGGIREIGLCCQPGINLPSWVLGILQVPAAYAPIDPDSPPSLSTYFMKKCDLKYLLVEKWQVNKFKSSHETVLNCDTVSVEHKDLVLFRLHWKNGEMNSVLGDRTEKYKVKNREDRARGENGTQGKECMDLRREGCLAYVLHTSGTTGTPKIVRVPHACILPNIQHFRSLFDITREDVLFLASPLTFDPSVVEIFVSLSSGACLLIVPTSVKVRPSTLADVLFSRHRVTVLQATPTLLRRFGSELIKSTVLSVHTSLRVLALGGEAFPSLTILQSWRAKGNRTQIFNIYGITEVSSWATFYRIPEESLNSTVKHESPVQLGTPLLGTAIEVRDKNGSPVLEGTGQVFLGGKNRVCFLDDEMTVPLGTMRATGDFVTVKDGELFFLGRKDSQIKRHGKRLNTALVQQVAEELGQVESCAVTWYNQEKLILFIVPKVDLVKDRIFKELQRHLPVHALPDDLVPIEALPFTCHGKVDVSKLNKIYLDYINSQPRNKLHGKEELWGKLKHLWKSVLCIPEDPEVTGKLPDNSVFLESGGDSLKAVWLLSEIEKLTGTAIPGLLEVILSSSILDVYNHIVEAVFTQEDLKANRSHTTKRKLSDAAPEEGSGEPACLESAWPLNHGSETNSVIALSRGSQVLSLGTGRLLTELGLCPPVCPLDLIPQTNTQVLKSISPSAPDGKLEKPPLSQQENPVLGPETMVLRERWRSDTGKCVDASPLLVIAAVEGKSSTTVYMGSHSHTVRAVDLYSGEMRWEQLLGDRIESSACVSKCGNFIIVGCYNGLIYVLKSNSGEKYWTFTTEDAVKSSPAVDPTTGLIYVGSHDQHAYALDIYEKKCVWKLKCEGALFSSPCVSLSPHRLYCATLGGILLAVNPAAGSTVWKRACGKPLFSSPRCCQRHVCIGCVDGSLLCFTHSGEQVWRFSAGGPIFSSPCISASEQIVFGSHDCFVYCCSMEGHLRWKFETTARVYATPFAFRKHLRSSDTLLAAASTDGKLWVLESRSGELRSVYELPGEVFSSPVVWESMLVIGCRNNYIYCLDLLCGDTNIQV